LQPRKNLVMLMKAYGIFRSRVESDVKLILAGSAYMWTSEMEKVLNAHPQKDEIVLTGRIEEKELHALLAAALALTYIPKYEGFGIPLIEAMASGTPIIASSVSSIPEVCDDAAILCNPNSAEEVAEAMMKISGDNMLRQHLVDKGLSRQQKFSWDNTASGLWRCIEKTMIPC